MLKLEDNRDSWLDQPVVRQFVLKWETVLFALILILAVFSRLYILGARVMSHDENTHVYYSWRFYQGQGFAHDPLMHGPLQFHLIALTYFMFGDNDFTARLPHALFSIATVALVWIFFRRYLGRAGALIGAALMLISPYMLYYGRYARNEAFVAFFVVAALWAILRFLDTGKSRYMYFLTAVTILHYTSKETSFIYSAQALLFLGFYLLFRISRLRWYEPAMRKAFVLAMIAALLLMAIFGGYKMAENQFSPSVTSEAQMRIEDSGQELQPLPASGASAVQTGLLILAGLAVLAAVYFLIRGFTWKALCAERSFSLILVQFTLVLPQLAAFPITWIGKLIDNTAWKVPTNAGDVMALTTTDIVRMAAVVIPLLIISVIIGLLWNRREWLINGAIWYSIFTILYTSIFTNGAGFFTGLVGSLGYWLEQQPVQRGGQPGYFYALVQVPVYEYLPLLGTLLACGIVIAAAVKKAFDRRQIEAADEAAVSVTDGNRLAETAAADQAVFTGEQSGVLRQEAAEFDHEQVANAALENAVNENIARPDNAVLLDETAVEEEKGPVFALLAFWSVTSLIAYSIAGEKMPWLTVHITLPMILCAGWALGKLVDAVDWAVFTARRGWLALALTPVVLLSFFASWGALLGPQPPFQGSTLDQLQATSTFMLSSLAFFASAAGLYILTRSWASGQLLRFTTLFFFVLLGCLTTRTAIQSSFISYDNANELLVYAHSAGGVKVAMAQIEEISERTTDGMGLSIAYDSETSYPYWWYLRNYTNVRFFGSDPTRSLRDAVVILVGDANFGKIEPVVGNAFYRFDYMRLWWPNQDYYGLTWERVWNALRDPGMRAAVFDIWLNRDYTRFGELTGIDTSLANWSPADRMRLYIRKDIVAQLWNYGVAPSQDLSEPVDPFDAAKQLKLTADLAFGEAGSLPGQFQHPRDLAVAPDGTIYVADSDNHRIQHLSRTGEVLHAWGTFGDALTTGAPGGAFNQPWGVAVGPDGSVFVADTWNHRVQKFSADGQFLAMWGYFGQAEKPEAFWGPRDVAVDNDGRVFVTDTGNKRVVVFDLNGQYLAQFGSAGMGPGQFDEPVGIAVDGRGQVFVADTWNQRIQVFTETSSGTFTQLRSWDMVAWFGQSLDNKPYLAVDGSGNVFAVEPEGYRVLWFNETGQPLHYWGDFGAALDLFGMPASIAIDPLGGVWVSDAGNNRIVHFTLPAP